jgi:hypothetical protein
MSMTGPKLRNGAAVADPVRVEADAEIHLERIQHAARFDAGEDRQLELLAALAEHVDLVLEHVGHVHRVRGRAPAHALVLAEDHAGHAREADAAHVERPGDGVARDEVPFVERRGRVEREVRIVRDHRRAGRAVPRRDAPLVAADEALAPLERLREARHFREALAHARRRRAGPGEALRVERAPRPRQERHLARRVGDRRGRVHRRDAAHVLEEQRRAVEAVALPRRDEASEGLRVARVDVEREARRDALPDHERVGRRPRARLRQLERGVLGRERMRREPVVHALGVGLEVRELGRRERRHRALGRAAQAHRAELHVAVERAGAEQLGEVAARLAPGRVHLEEAVARVHEAHRTRQVEVVLREEMRHAGLVDLQLDRSGEARQRDGLGGGGRRGSGENERDDENVELRHDTSSRQRAIVQGMTHGRQARRAAPQFLLARGADRPRQSCAVLGGEAARSDSASCVLPPPAWRSPCSPAPRTAGSRRRRAIRSCASSTMR